MKRSFGKYRETGERLTMLTAYDAAFASLLEKAGIDCILVGDSLGNVFQGVSSTREVTVEQMVYHTRSVRAGAPNAFIWTDMPYLSYETPESAVANARRLIEAGADGVKLEGYRKGIVRALTDAGIPVCAHIGLLPQTADNFKVRGKEESEQMKLKNEAAALQEEGAVMTVIECTSSALAAEITESLDIPTIGIGAGRYTNGQVLVADDILGKYGEFKPKFARKYGSAHSSATSARAIIPPKASRTADAFSEKTVPESENQPHPEKRIAEGFIISKRKNYRQYVFRSAGILRPHFPPLYRKEPRRSGVVSGDGGNRTPGG